MKYNPKWSFATWIFSIAKNSCYQYLNNRKRENRLIEELEFIKKEKIESSDNAFKHLLRKEIEDLILEIKLPLRTVFILRTYNKLKFEDISKICNCSVRTAKYRMKLATDSLLQKMRSKGITKDLFNIG